MVGAVGTGLHGIGWNGLGAIGSYFADRPWISARTGLIGLAGMLAAGCVGWMLFSSRHIDHIAAASTAQVAMTSAVDPASALVAAASKKEATPAPPSMTELAAPVEGLRISSQHWRRGGLGSNAFVSFTLRNTNRYAVKDIESSCAFSRSDGSHLTDRTRVIHETVRRRSRKAFRQLHVGFVNVNADRGRCSLIGASRA